MDPRKRAERETTKKNYLLKLFVKTKRLIDDRLKGRNHTNRNARQNEMLILKAKKFLHGGKEQEKSLVIDDVWTKQAEEAKASWGAAIRQSNLFAGHS